ncbi:DUF1405 domain-containing protein [Anaerobacillus sp. CMMVII]|uniref:DUF1405 domain-containing protein n=1 Tax=Anaerobacillus sp. CMMVII TaxID=2755588 RepID=UPI0021B75D1E|nr:DUF1405 domain-containing protein [Anaerobacillus sp. CMMVII]MCT8138912.1 DUF1405 domain-containing protein [Anaerobacillus sp. CMMVII]
MINYFIRMLREPWVLFILLVANLLGTIYGYWWYKEQLAITPAQFYIFVPDSPTASLFLVFVLAAFLLKKNWPLMEAFAAVTLIKYGVWAVVMNIAAGVAGATLSWQNYMLIASHLAMAVQALLFAPYFRIKPWHLVVVSVWTLHNDIIDYVFGMHPWVSRVLLDYIAEIGYFTFWLSILSIVLVYLFAVRKNRFKLNL